jgi:glycosyltransferase involved in cell wall biosynthesis
MSADRHILILPSWYPTLTCPIRGTFIREQVMALGRAGIKVGVIYPDFRSLREFKITALADNYFQTSISMDRGVPIYRYHGWNISRLKLEPCLWKRQAKRLFCRYTAKHGIPDLIHAHGILWGGVSAAEIAASENIPYLITEHASNYAQGMISSWQEPYIRRTVKTAAKVMAVSKALADKLMPYTEGKRIEVLPNMVDTGYFILPPVQRKINPFRFLTVARLTPKKGVDLLIRAFARAFSQEQDVFLDIGGDGEQRPELEALVKDLRIQDRVNFLGELSLEQVRESMWHANAFVLPSYVETFGVVLIEAMATGLAAIATSCGGPDEFINSDTGRLVKPGDVEELSDALKNIYEHRFELDRRESGIRDYIVNNYSDTVIVERLLGFYNQVLNGEYNKMT